MKIEFTFYTILISYDFILPFNNIALYFIINMIYVDIINFIR